MSEGQQEMVDRIATRAFWDKVARLGLEIHLAHRSVPVMELGRSCEQGACDVSDGPCTCREAIGV